MADERERDIRKLTELRKLLQGELDRKQSQIEGLQIAINCLEGNARMEEVQANRDRAENEHRKGQADG